MTGEADIKAESQPGQPGGPPQGESNGPNSETKVFENRRGRGGRFSMLRRPDGRNEDGSEQQNRGPGNRGGFMGRGRGGGGRGGGNRNDSASGILGGAGRGGEGSFFLNERLLKTINGPTVDLPTAEYKEKKFNGRCRLYVGNLPQDITEDEFNNIFAPYGSTSELYINKEKNFAFIRLDYRSTAEKAKRELDGFSIRNRNLRVRFAPLGSTIKVKNLTSFVTNELLELGFSVFGEIERAMVCVDERGNSLKEGIIEFTRKGSALSALRYCTDGCFFLTSSLKPVIAEAYEPTEDNDGYSEKMITKKTPDYYQAREVGPRFAKQGSFEYEFGKRWKQMHELYKQKEESLRRELKHEEEKLEAQLQYAKYEHETELLREQLRQREMDRERQKREWEMKERQAEEHRVAEEEALRRQQEDLSRRMLHQEDELRRRQQENSIFMQTHQLNNLMDQSESPARPGGGGGGGVGSGYANNSSMPGDAIHDYPPIEGGPRPMMLPGAYKHRPARVPPFCQPFPPPTAMLPPPMMMPPSNSLVAMNPLPPGNPYPLISPIPPRMNLPRNVHPPNMCPSGQGNINSSGSNPHYYYTIGKKLLDTKKSEKPDRTLDTSPARSRSPIVRPNLVQVSESSPQEPKA